MDDFGMKDSGERIIFGENKDVREPATGKGRFDLILPFAMKRLALVLEKGAAKYADRNWEKGGIPTARYIDSLKRHINQFEMGMEDEDHLGQAMYNIMALLHFDEMGDFTDDNLPKYLKSKKVENKNTEIIDNTITNDHFEEELKRAVESKEIEEKIEEKIEKVEKVKKVKEIIKTDEEESEDW